MPITATVRRAAFNSGYQGWINLTFNQPITGSMPIAGQVLTIAGDVQVTVQQELPNSSIRGRITQTPRGSNRLIIKPGDTVSG